MLEFITLILPLMPTGILVFSAVSHNDTLSARYAEQETKDCGYFGTGSQ